MAATDVSALDMRDVPDCLRAVRLKTWRAGPTGNGQSVCYGTFEEGTALGGEPQWFEVQPATGSDYSGGTVTLANLRELKRRLSESEDPGLPDCVWCTAYGGHGTYALFVVYAALPEEVQAVLAALDDYPSVDDEALFELETQLGSDAWASWGSAELRLELEQAFETDLEQMAHGDLFELFRVASECVGHDWEFEQGAQAHFDFARAAREVSKVLDAPPTWLTSEQVSALEVLRALMSATEANDG